MAKVADPFGMSCVLSTIGLLALIINSLFVVRYGRRRVLLMTGLLVCGVLQLIIAVVYDKNPGTTNGYTPLTSVRVRLRLTSHVKTSHRRRDPDPTGLPTLRFTTRLQVLTHCHTYQPLSRLNVRPVAAE